MAHKDGTGGRDWVDLTLRAGAAVALVVLAALIGLIIMNEVLLDLHHQSTTATVLRITGDHGPPGADVRFTDPLGQGLREAHVELQWSGGPSIGDHIAIEYDPGNPGRARRAGAHDVFTVLEFALGFLAIAVGITIVKRFVRPRGH